MFSVLIIMIVNIRYIILMYASMIIKMQLEWMHYVIEKLIIKFISIWDYDFFDMSRETKTS